MKKQKTWVDSIVGVDEECNFGLDDLKETTNVDKTKDGLTGICNSHDELLNSIQNGIKTFKNKYSKFYDTNIHQNIPENLGEYALKAIPVVSSENRYDIAVWSKDTKSYRDAEKASKKNKTDIMVECMKLSRWSSAIRFIAVSEKLGIAQQNGMRKDVTSFPASQLFLGLHEQHLNLIPSKLKQTFFRDLYKLKVDYHNRVTPILHKVINTNYEVEINTIASLTSQKIPAVGNDYNSTDDKRYEFQKFVPVERKTVTIDRVELCTNDYMRSQDISDYPNSQAICQPHILCTMFSGDKIIDTCIMAINTHMIVARMLPEVTGTLERILERSGLSMFVRGKEQTDTYGRDSIDYHEICSLATSVDTHKVLDIAEVRDSIKLFYQANKELMVKAQEFETKYEPMIFTNSL